MTTVSIACIVEGHSEVESLPILLRRIVATIDPMLLLKIPPPWRVSKSSFLKEEAQEIERSVEYAARTLYNQGAILILLDADDDCPAKLGPTILQRARSIRPEMPMAAVIANREYEAWFIAAATSLSGKKGLQEKLVPPASPESIRGAKEWLEQHMQNRQMRYSETLHQSAFTANFSIDEAKSAPSFDKLFRDVERLIRSQLEV